MKFLEGKSPTEKKKIIAALVLGVLSLTSLLYAFGPSLGRSSASVKVTASPTPRSDAAPRATTGDVEMPSRSEQLFEYSTQPIMYSPGTFVAPEPGRNIFAFYEPPPPCPTCPTPIKPTPTPMPPTPPPTPDIYIVGINPQSVYAGSRGFRLELMGERIEPDARIYFSQMALPTTVVNENRIFAEVPANMIAAEGPRQVIVQTPDGKKYSNQMMVTVQAPPKPSFKYIGMLGRKRYNNDTAYFEEDGRPAPTSARLNDVVGGRFRLISISAEETIFEDVNLGFRHKVQLHRPAPGTAAAGAPPPSRGGFPGGNFIPYNPGANTAVPMQNIPGIPDNIPRYTPPGNNNPQAPRPPRPDQQKKDDSDDDGDDGR